MIEGLGRYEKVNSVNNKYWHIIYDRTTQTYKAQWGKRTASKPQGEKVYTAKEAQKKIREKTNDGYVKVKGYQEEAGANSLHFIMSDDNAA